MAQVTALGMPLPKQAERQAKLPAIHFLIRWMHRLDAQHRCSRITHPRETNGKKAHREDFWACLFLIRHRHKQNDQPSEKGSTHHCSGHASSESGMSKKKITTPLISYGVLLYFWLFSGHHGLPEASWPWPQLHGREDYTCNN